MSVKREQSRQRWTSLHGQSSPTARLPVVTPSPSDPYDFLDLLTYLAKTIDGATHGGGAHGGTARRADGGTPVTTLAAQPNVRTSIYELRGT